MTRPLAAVTVVVAIAASLLLSAWRRAQVVPEASLDAAAEAVRKQFVSGDVIIVEPRHQVGPRVRLGDLPLLEPRDLHPDELARYRRAFLLELDVFGNRGSLAARLREHGSVSKKDIWPGLELTTFTLAAKARVLFDLRQDIADATVVARYPDGVSSRCDRFRRDRWLCPRDSEWSYVGREIREIEAQPRPCVWMHPLHRGGQLRVSLPALAASASDKLILLGGFGLTDHAAKRAQAPVRVRISDSEGDLLATSQPVSQGWRRFRREFSTQRQPLTIAVESDNNGVAHFCFAATVLEPFP